MNMSFVTNTFGKMIRPETDLVPEAFVYKFTHEPTGRWYIGMHGLKENESPFDDTYWNSSTSEEFQYLLETKQEEFCYEILEYGTMISMFKKENSLLTELDAQNDPLSWNKWNGFPYQTEELPRLKIIDKLADEAYKVDSDEVERKSEKVAELYHSVVRLQVRFDSNKSHKKISEYRNEMKANNSTKGFTLTIVRRDGQKVLVGGNHTLEAAKNFIQIDVVYIDEDLSMEELQALGNALNRKKEIARMTTAMEDCASDLIELYKSGKIKDPKFKTKYCSDYIKVTGGFKGRDITKVRRLAVDQIKDEGEWKKGKKWINWKNNNTKHKRSDQLASMVSAETDDSTFCVSSSSTFRADRIQEHWIKDSDTRVALGKNSRPNIKILMHYPSYTSMKEYIKNENEKTHLRVLTSFLIGEGMENPIVTFQNVDFWEDKIS